jgi:F-type H+-transporting ATPase subunit gamma
MAVAIRLLRRRIKTAKNIAQITRAMEMVAASKMRRGQERTLAGKPYAEKLRGAVENLVGRVEEGVHRYLESEEGGKTLIILFSSDKGLCGSFHANLTREFMRFTSIHKEAAIITVGKKLERLAARSGGALVADFPFGTTVPSFDQVYPIVNLVAQGVAKGEYGKVFLIFTQFLSLRSQTPVTMQLLPIERGGGEEEFSPYQFEPDVDSLLKALMPHYLEVAIYQILLESYASEQAARMLAMHQASENAKDVIWELSLFYNKARQERITSELLDISGSVMEGMV